MMTRFARLSLVAPLALLASVGGCRPAPVPATVAASDAWARATSPAQDSAAAYLTLTSSVDDRLLAVSSPVGSASLHETMSHHHVAGMVGVAEVELPAGQPVELRPGGIHVMLSRVKAPLVAGRRFDLTLTFAHARPLTVAVTVVDPASR